MPIEELKRPDRIDEDRIEKLKELFPEAFGDGKLNINILKEEIEFINSDLIEEQTDEFYGLQWVGKKEARKLSLVPSNGTLSQIIDNGIREGETKNLVIEGDNLEVLRILQKSYSSRIDMIYIDPPYNTGNDFVYKDNFYDSTEKYLQKTKQADEDGLLSSNPKESGRYHANWLSMMYPRLKLAKNLLSNDGFIFVSIDENEHQNLISILNEIFGEKNFVADFIWKARSGITGTISSISYQHEYVVCYSKSEHAKLKMIEVTSEGGNFEDSKGKYKREQLRQWGQADRRIDRPKMWYAIPTPTGELAYPIKSDGTEGRWRVGEETAKELLEKGELDFEMVDGQWQVYRKIRAGRITYKPYGTILDNHQTTADGTKVIKELFGEKIMDFPKPLKLIEFLIDIGSHGKDDAIIMDFFAGSGTTGHAVMEYNKKNNTNKRFILIQIPEETPLNSPAREMGFKTISQITVERIKKVIKNLETIEIGNSDIDLGVKTYRLNNSNIRKWFGYHGSSLKDLSKEINLFSHNDVFEEGSNDNDIVIELMLSQGFPLDSSVKVSEIASNSLWIVEHDNVPFSLIVCLDEKLQEETGEFLNEKFDKATFICLDNALSNEQKILLSESMNVKTI